MNILDDIIEKYDGEEILKADGFDDAIIGIDESSMRLVYSVSKCLEILEEDMSEEDAIEHFDFNVRGAYVGEKTPIWCDDTVVRNHMNLESPSKYLEDRLQAMANLIPNTTLSYFYDLRYSQHVILVNPPANYEKMAKPQIEFELAFIKGFPHESIFFTPGIDDAPANFNKVVTSINMENQTKVPNKTTLKVGDTARAIMVEPLPGKTVAPPLKLGDTHEVKAIIQDSQGNDHIDIGLKSEYNYIRSFETDEDLPGGDKIHFCHPSRLEKA